MTDDDKTNIVRIDFCSASVVWAATLTSITVRIIGKNAKFLDSGMSGVGAALQYSETEEKLVAGKAKRIMRNPANIEWLCLQMMPRNLHISLATVARDWKRKLM